MALINKDNTLYLGRGEYTERPISYTKNIQEYDKDFWYCEFFNDESISLLYDQVILSPDAIERFKAKTCYMVLNNAHEAFHTVVKAIYDVCVLDMEIPVEQIVLISESAVIDKEVENVAKQYNLGKIKTKWMRIFEFGINNVVVHHKVNDECKTLQHKNYTKKFLNLNRRWRLHRPALVALLKIKDLVKYGYISLATSDDYKNWHVFFDEIRWTFKDNPEFLSLFEQNEDLIKTIPELRLDKSDMTINYASSEYLKETTMDYFYENSYFSVVSETNFFQPYGEGVFVSEKIFRPIQKKHPFIVLARPKTLEAMKSIGYRTFGNIIDESYDSEFDDYKRMTKIIDEINRLCNLSGSDLTNFLAYARETTNYNYSVLKNKTSFITDL